MQKKTERKALIVSLFVLCFLISGCQQIQDWSRKTPEVNNTINQTTNQTQEPIVDVPISLIEENKTNIFIFQSNESCVFIADKDNKTSLVDCGNEDVLKVIKNMKKFGFDKTDNFYYTKIKKDMDLLTEKFEPSKILEIEYLVFDRFFYSGICVAECEDKITIEDIPILFLANEGLCPTNSLKFLIKINPEIIISNANLCADIKEKINVLEIPIYYKDKRDIHIVMNETDYWVKE